MRLLTLPACAGLLLAGLSIAAALLLRFPAWYTPFLLGSLLFYDSLDRTLTGRSLLTTAAAGHWRGLVAIYLISVALTAIVDLWFGRGIANAWVYPYWPGWLGIAVPLLLHYPLGMLMLFESYRAIYAWLTHAISPTSLPPTWPPDSVQPLGPNDQGRSIERQPSFRLPQSRWLGFHVKHPDALSGERRFHFLYGRLSLLILTASLLLPPLNFWFGGNRDPVELQFLILLAATFGFDGARELVTGDSLLGAARRRAPALARAVVLTVLLAWGLDEGPNWLAGEWVYTRTPFGLPIWVALLPGWLFLLSVSLALTTITLTVLHRLPSHPIAPSWEASNLSPLRLSPPK